MLAQGRRIEWRRPLLHLDWCPETSTVRPTMSVRRPARSTIVAI